MQSFAMRLLPFWADTSSKVLPAASRVSMCSVLSGDWMNSSISAYLPCRHHENSISRSFDSFAAFSAALRACTSAAADESMRPSPMSDSSVDRSGMNCAMRGSRP